MAPSLSKLLAGCFPDSSSKQNKACMYFLRELPKAKKISYISSQCIFFWSKEEHKQNNRIVHSLCPQFSVEKCQMIDLFECKMRFLTSLEKIRLFGFFLISFPF